MKDMIYGVNPFTISEICWQKARRYGEHPYLIRLQKKKYPLLRWSFSHDERFCFFYKASVVIYGSNGGVLKHIACSSNDAAEKLCVELNQRLRETLSGCGLSFDSH